MARASAALSATRPQPSRPRAQAGNADAESRLSDAHHASLRLWMRMFTCTQMIERQVRGRLRDHFAITLARFDLMAQLERHPQGLKMGELSRRMMVTGGNVTGLTAGLIDEGLVERRPCRDDRRAHAVRLTRRGKRAFDAMAVEHERWIVDMLGALPVVDQTRLHALLGRLKHGLGQSGKDRQAW